MRMIGTIPADADAERFSDYLVTVDVPNMVEEGAGGWAVWVERDDDLDRAKGELDAFLRNPADAKYNGAARTAERIRKQEEKKQEPVVQRAKPPAQPGDVKPVELGSAEDFQLQQAIAHLKGEPVKTVSPTVAATKPAATPTN